MSKLRNILLTSIALITICWVSPSYPQTGKTQRTQSKNKQSVKITSQKIEKDIVGKTTDDSIWRFEKNEPRKITVLESKYGNPYATVIVNVETEGFAGVVIYALRGYANGKLRLHYEWITNEWILVKVENLTFKIIRTEAIVPKTPATPKKSPIEKEIKRKLEATFLKYPNPNSKEGLPKAEVTYLALGDVFEYENNMRLFEITDFRIDVSGNAVSSSDIERGNGIDWEWKGGGRTTAKAVREWDDKLKTWGSYKNPDFDCGITATKQKGKDYEITPLRCIPGNITAFVLSQEVINFLERREVNFDEFADRTKIEFGNINLKQAKQIKEAIISRIFRQCSDGKWYTSSMGLYGSSNPGWENETTLIHQLETLKVGFNWNNYKRIPNSVWEGEIEFAATTHHIYEFNSPSWVKQVGDAELGSLHLYNENNSWFVGIYGYRTNKSSFGDLPTQKWDENIWVITKGGALFRFPQRIGGYGSAQLRPTDCATVNKMLASNPVSQ